MVSTEQLLYEYFRFLNLEFAQHLIVNVLVLVVECLDCGLLHLSERHGNVKTLLHFAFDLVLFEKLISDVFKLLLINFVQTPNLS